ncbi:ferrous iron transport protein B [Neolewinella lacunae]|uniref:Ferrous iron transport protein B n=1 Tax=Neolewinella lacunae TaxID=1517758 RepID=A0A923PHL6_9BACT|nr:ferrous iron transport protein B [Neolewinella lacunae]MBC6992765.1 ferrous iron transport protein B [Neolewinella lacunae]MDN3636009.1 ferrous iron transport protein B [Neolewinella lacunae]
MHNDQVKRRAVVGLVGNPNSGKSSLFNALTGLRQRIGNFPGVTVEKKSGEIALASGVGVELVDFPGAYSCYPTSLDERLVVQELTNPKGDLFPDAILYVADVTKLDKHLLLFTQLRDLDLPMILVLNMMDVIQETGLQVNVARLSRELAVPVLLVSAREGQGLEELKTAVADLLKDPAKYRPEAPFYEPGARARDVLADLRQELPARNDYHALLLTHHASWLRHIPEETRHLVQQARVRHEFHSLRAQVEETMERYNTFEPIVRDSVRFAGDQASRSERLDNILTHRIWGPLIFLAVMFLLFQALFAWAEWPMNGIEWVFETLGTSVRATLVEGWLTNLLVDGIIAGLGGVLVFIPQIAILFFFIAILEEVGYLARAAYLFDSLMQRFGLNGRSVVALISGHACAIPAIMSTRTIANWKERLLTIMVTPLTSCSARIPVYVILISFAVPKETFWGFGLQGLAFAGLYFLGIAAAMLSALVFKLVLKTPERSFLMLELPEYRTPVWRNVGLTVWQKVRTFVEEAGKVILLISIVLWGLSSFGPSQRMAAAEANAARINQELGYTGEAAEDVLASERLEASYAGLLGKAMEPVIRPLGYDWKIGIALLASFAAREVFVGTMATIYSIGSVDDELRIRERMAEEINPRTGQPVYNSATAWSLLIFYVFAMMCMSTLAVTRRETGGWKWPAIQFTFMTVLAYFSAMGVYQVLS